jgi:hypothetical protein
LLQARIDLSRSKLMAAPSLSDLTAAAAQTVEPSFTAARTPKFGGVDPLGLRQINFDMMDQVLSGVNNVARHVRPFVLVAWAWRRAKHVAEKHGLTDILDDDLRDFVDRIEVIYAWSQFLRNPNADLPGRQVLSAIVRADRWSFGGEAWRKRRRDRRYSTAFTAPITYGPALKALGWVAPHEKYPDVLEPSTLVAPALDAFESLISDRLDHPAFSQFGPVEVSSEDVAAWAEAWALDEVTEPEQRVAAELLLGTNAPVARRNGCALMLAATAHGSTLDLNNIRSTMAGAPSNFYPSPELQETVDAWRRLQVRQLFRLSLEAWFHWIVTELDGSPRSSEQLVESFVSRVDRPPLSTARDWLSSATSGKSGPTSYIDQIAAALNDAALAELPSRIIDGLAFCLSEAPESGQLYERPDRLPLFRARREFDAMGEMPPKVFVRHVIEGWILAQHVYWAVGRGLADARSRGKTILRLKVVLEEGGWTLTPGVTRGSPPVPTPDRLHTVLSLASECGLTSAGHLP